MNRYVVTLEPTAFLGRVHRADAAVGPMPWQWIGISHITFNEHRVATVKGLLLGERALGIYDALGKKLESIGATGAEWARGSDGQMREPFFVKLNGDGMAIYL